MCKPWLASLQLLSSINKQIVKGLAATDLKLEEVGLLPKVEQEKLPEDITDEDGNLLNDCAEVIPLPAFPICTPAPDTQGCADHDLYVCRDFLPGMR